MVDTNDTQIRAWEGYGGPIQRERANMGGIDPTLDSCCLREEEDIRRKTALNRTLQRFDIARQRERQRKNLVSTSAFDGCRCCYDPNSDGGMYRALMELREKMSEEKAPNHSTFSQANMFPNEDTKEDILADTKSETSSEDEFDYLLNEDDQNEEMKFLEDQRRAELEFQALQREISMQHGFGVHRQMHPNRALKAALLAPFAVFHLVDPDSIASASLDVFLEDSLAPKNPGTKFLRSGGRSTLLLERTLAAKHLPRLKPDTDMPALVAFRDGVAVAYCPRLESFTDIRGDEKIIPSIVEDWLDRAGVLESRAPVFEELCRIRPEEEALLDSMYATKQTDEICEEERYDCGRDGCMKSFPHEHVGEKTAQQDGLVVPETTILGESELISSS